jgi:hypothetical protein
MDADETETLAGASSVLPMSLSAGPLFVFALLHFTVPLWWYWVFEISVYPRASAAKRF